MKSSHPHANDHRTPKALADQTAGLDLFAVEKQSAQGKTTEATERDAREIAMSTHRSKSEIVQALRDAAKLEYQRQPRPISANDIRHALPDGESKKVLGVVFQDRYWTRFGSTETSCPGATKTRVGANRGEISTYVPTHLLEMWKQKAEGREVA